MKPCPYCAEEIQEAATLCRFCGRPQPEMLPQPIDPELKRKIARHEGRYSEKRFWKKVARWAKRAGKGVIKHATTLFYTAQDPDTPTWIRAIIYGALGYFISPIDGVPDILPGGFLDDLAMLSAALLAAHLYVKPEHYQHACERMKEWFGEEDGPEPVPAA